MIYLQRHPKAYIHAIYGPTDALLYPGVDKLITSIDLTSASPSFVHVSKRSVLNDLGLTEDQFLDVGILLGFEHSPPFPPTLHDQALKATVDMVKYYKSGHLAVGAFIESPQVKQMQYNEQYARARSMIKYSLVLSSEGTVIPLPLASPNTAHGHQNHGPHHPTAADIPSDLHDIFTHRLPDEIYFYLSRGLMGPQALVWLASGQIIETPPLDNGETTEYRRFVKEVITDGQTGPRATSLALISSVVHTFWSKRSVVGHFWFENQSSQKPILHSSPATVQLAERVSGWHVPYAIIEEELRRQNVSVFSYFPHPNPARGAPSAVDLPIVGPLPFDSPPRSISLSALAPLRLKNSLIAPRPRTDRRRSRSTKKMRSLRTSSGVSWSCEGASLATVFPYSSAEAHTSDFSGMTRCRSSQVLAEHPHTFTSRARNVCRHQASKNSGQVPRLAIPLPGTCEGWRDAWPSLVWTGV